MGVQTYWKKYCWNGTEPVTGDVEELSGVVKFLLVTCISLSIFLLYAIHLMASIIGMYNGQIGKWKPIVLKMALHSELLTVAGVRVL